MNFGQALEALWNGKHLTRLSWNGPDQYVALVKQENVIPNPFEVQMSQPFLYIYTVQKTTVPWLASQTDLLATDWEIV